jgi:superfamily II DNA or RNA helicase
MDDASWPEDCRFPVNERPRRVERWARENCEASGDTTIATGYSSLSYLVRVFGDGRPRSTRIVLGNEPQGLAEIPLYVRPLAGKIREHWLEQGISVLQGQAVLQLIAAIETGQVRFRLLDNFHAKVLAGPVSAIVGSSNFSRAGLVTQREANVRFTRGSDDFEAVHRIAANFWNAGSDFNNEIIRLLRDILKPCNWREALARSVAELLEDDWITRYPEIHRLLTSVPLWPSQRQAIGQALHILDERGSVLLADPTGSGKTRLGIMLVLSLMNRLYRLGRGHQTNCLVVCPPMVQDEWKMESQEARTLAIETVSHGLLSRDGTGRDQVLRDLRIANILVIDEAHNYLNQLSTRSRTIRYGYTDHVLLLTATPINRRAQDLLRLVEILGLDNLSEEQFDTYRQLRANRVVTKEVEKKFASYIRGFTVRRTKKELNRQIDEHPDEYRAPDGRLCRFPRQKTETYDTGETSEDSEIAGQINQLAEKLQGLLYLRRIKKPPGEDAGRYNEAMHLASVLHAATALARYNVLAAMRSSHVALVEHVEGTAAAAKSYGLKPGFKDETGDVVNTIKKLRFEEVRFDLQIPRPDFLVSHEAYASAVDAEVQIYSEIARLGRRMSDSRQKARVHRLKSLADHHRLILAFDSRVITLEYLHQLMQRETGPMTMVVHGSRLAEKRKIKERFKRGSEESWVALCSDAMSEGVNLQEASAVVFLDMPGVIRLAEQRIGRIDRMNSRHQEIEVWWPNDSEPFRLRSSLKFLKRYRMVDNIIGTNIPIPSELQRLGKEESFEVKRVIELLRNQRQREEESVFLTDAFERVRGLKGNLLTDEIYRQFRFVQATVRSRVSFVSSTSSWGFFALRGTRTRAPRWVLVRENRPSTDLHEISEWLEINLPQSSDLEWDETTQDHLSTFIGHLHGLERELLPNRRRRALTLLEKCLDRWTKRPTYASSPVLDELARIIRPGQTDNARPDLYELTGRWLDLLQPYFDRVSEKKRQRGVRLADLRPLLTEEPVPVEDLESLLKDLPFLPPVDRQLAACIVGVVV